MASCDLLYFVSTVLSDAREADVDLPYTAKTHQRHTRARSRALVAHPREDLRPVDEVRVRGKRDGRERLALSAPSIYASALVMMWMFVSLLRKTCPARRG